MRLTPAISKITTVLFVTCAITCAPLSAQTPEPPRQDQTDVLRVFTELVQTDVMVFDKQGHFVDGLKKDDFELRIDGQPKPIDFFERITAGSANEESQLAAARGTANRSGNNSAPVPLDRGRPIFFYLDDFHLDPASLKAAKKVVSDFIDNQMGQNDEAAITSASGQVGFLQQLTDNKRVLHAALDRVTNRNYVVRDTDTPPMTEYQAMQIENFDRDLTNFFISRTIAQNPGMTPETAEAQVRNRARNMLQQAESVTLATLGTLDGLVHSVNKLPGRKLVFFISGGFFLNPHESSFDRLQTITSAAGRSGVVIYSIDARGLFTGLPDAASDTTFDTSGILSRSSLGEASATQDAMNALARDTGGKAVFNTNALDVGLKRALQETSAYYLLAWKPQTENHHENKFHRIEVKVIGRPQLTVQVRRGFFDVDPDTTAAKPAKQKPDATNKPVSDTQTADTDLRRKLAATFPDHSFPVALNLGYVNTSDKGWMLSTMVEVPSSALTFEKAGDKQVAAVEVAGVFYNDHGQSGGSFNNRITVEAKAAGAADGGSVRYSYPIFLAPGLYQVRVGARDAKSGRIGSAQEWVEIPNLKPGQLGLSSILVGVKPPAVESSSSETNQSLTNSLEISISHRFQRDSNLRFLVFIYNAQAAAATDSKPDIAFQVQLIRDGQPVVTTPLKKIQLAQVADPSKIPYAAEIPLNGLPPGRYLMQFTLIDRNSKQSATQQTRFEIE